jgi:hypothetical protein
VEILEKLQVDVEGPKPRDLLLVGLRDDDAGRILESISGSEAWTAPSRETADSRLRREGFRVGVIVVAPGSELQDCAKWIFQVRNEFPWTVFVLHIQLEQFKHLLRRRGIVGAASECVYRHRLGGHGSRDEDQRWS